MKLNVLVVGSGGREHALALALSRDETVVGVQVAPGNPGTWDLGTSYGVGIGSEMWRRISETDPLDGIGVAVLAKDLGANLVVIGPEAPLVAGVADEVRAHGIACFGPSAEAARLEGSKQFAKEVMDAAGVPTAQSLYCRTNREYEAALDRFGPPHVVKKDGLAAGKGVVVTDDRSQALAHARSCGEVVIEEYLDGPEVSLFAICDGETAVPLIPAQDFKRARDGDTGPNTGGMGAYAPLPWAPQSLVDEVMDRVVTPTLAEMKRRGTPFQGLLYAGLALTGRGLRVVEFNARFGDPETEAILPLLRTGLGGVLYAAATGTLDQISPLTWEDGYSVVVVYAAQGYPNAGRTQNELARSAETKEGVEVRSAEHPDAPVKGGSIQLPKDAQIIHCGTALDARGDLVAHGGRVLGIVAQGTDVAQARNAAYRTIDDIDFPTGFYRTDIAQKAAEGLIPTPTL